jgi:hypothetical protein
MRSLYRAAVGACALALVVVAFPAAALASLPALEPAHGSGAFPISFTVSGGKLKLQTAPGGLEHETACKTTSGSGSFSGAKKGSVTLELGECLAGGILTCGNAKAGEIKTKELSALLAYTYPSKTTAEGGREAALVLSPASGEVLAEYTCHTTKTYVVKGSIVVPIGPVNAMASIFSLTLKQAKGSQEAPTEYETEGGGHTKAGLTCKENSNPAEKCAVEASPAITLGEEAKVAVEGESLPAFSHTPQGFLGTLSLSSFSAEGVENWAFKGGNVSGGVYGGQYIEKMHFIYTEPPALGTYCYNGEKELREEFHWNTLSGRLGYINKTEKRVGLRLESTGQPLATCTDGNYDMEITGRLVAEVGPINTNTNKYTLHFKPGLTLEGEIADPPRWKQVGTEEATKEVKLTSEATMVFEIAQELHA